MSAYPLFTIYTGAEDVEDSGFVVINFASAGFTEPPIVTASTDRDDNLYVSNITSSTARIHFSAPFTGRVSYIIQSPGIVT